MKMLRLFLKKFVFVFSITLLTLGVLGNMSYGDTSQIYWTDTGTGKIQRSDLDGTNIKNIITEDVYGPEGIALDVAGGKVYWSDGNIQRANLDGTNIQDIVTLKSLDPLGLADPHGIALDIVNEKIYWTDWFASKIQRANLDGTDIQDIITEGLEFPEKIALDVTNGKIYWTSWLTEKIQCADMDGTNIQDVVITESLDFPQDIALDVAGNKIYWTSSGFLVPNKIQRANLDGTNIQDLITTGLKNPSGIALDVTGNKMYWTDKDSGKIQRANLDGSNVRDIVTGLDEPIGIALSIPSKRTPVVVKADDPGNTRSKATPLPLGTSYTEKIDPGNDVDYFSVKVNDTGQLKLYTTGDLNTVGVLQNSSGVRLVKNDDGGSDDNFRIEHTVDPGTYYLKITSSGTNTGNYTVYAMFTPAVSVEETSPYQSIYWVDTHTNKILWANLDGTNPHVYSNGYPRDIALNAADGKLYWTDGIRDKIQRANLDGTNIEDIITGLDGPRGLALDVAGGKMYWTNRNYGGDDQIRRANLDGTNIETLLTKGLDGPWDIALDVAGGKMYWTNRYEGKIQRANLNGSNVQDVVTDLLPHSLALDVASGKMYWTSGGYSNQTIQRANLNGTGIELLITEGLDEPAGIALDIAAGKMYWADEGTGKIQRANLNGTNVQTILIGLREPSAIALGTTSPGVWDVDVNGDGKVTHLDIIEVGKNYGKTVAGGANPRADVTGNGKVDINDLIAVAKAVDAAAAAPILVGQLPDIPFTAQDLEQWIRDAKHQNLSARGIAVLEHLLEALTRSKIPPKKTALLPNYPNPFNPETWIPYQLAEPADVTVTIYAANGSIVRTLALGHQPVGMYQNRSRAAYWDGKNALGEPIASGLYFYTLTAGDFTATRRMLILK